jgi:CheY-like chemotaxis protein
VKSLYIIAMTAHVLPGAREKCFESGMNAYVSKPVELEDLKGALEKVVLPPEKPSPIAPEPAPIAKAPQAPSSVVPLPDNAETPPVDFRRLNRVCLNDPTRRQDLVELYLRQTQQDLQALAAAVAAAAAPRVNQLAHKCAGASLTCGMVSIVPRCGNSKNWAAKAN